MTVTVTHFKLLALLLQYPDEAMTEALPEMEAVVRRLPADERRRGIEVFLSGIKTCGAIPRMECYTAAFDLQPSTSLNMTYHVWGNSEKRAGALVDLQRIYHAAGYERTTGELPDYLPLIFEFLSVVPAAQQADTIRRCLEGLGVLSNRLQETAPMYAGLLKPFADSLGEEVTGAPVAQSPPRPDDALSSVEGDPID